MQHIPQFVSEVGHGLVPQPVIPKTVALSIVHPVGISFPAGGFTAKDTAGKTKTANNETTAKIDNIFFIRNKLKIKRP